MNKNINNEIDNQKISNQKTLIITFIGAPNVGKSTIVNSLIGEKISAISPKPHTTRLYLRGMLTEENTQLIFVDTPGFMHQKAKMDTDADVVCMVLDAKNPWQYDMKNRIQKLLEQLEQDQFYIAINKSDIVSKDQLFEIIQELIGFGYKNQVWILAAIARKGLEQLKQELINLALPYPWLFPADMKHELQDKDIIIETVREKIFHLTYHELPYTIKLELIDFKEPKKGKDASGKNVGNKNWSASILIKTDKASQKNIVIGKGARTIKAIGEAARVELCSRFGPGHLFLEVK